MFLTEVNLHATVTLRFKTWLLQWVYSAISAILLFLPYTPHGSEDMALAPSKACLLGNTTLMLFLAKIDKIAFAMLSPVVLSRSTWSKNTYLILGETSLFRSKNIRQTLNISWFANLSATSSPMIEKKVSSFWISCIIFARIYSPVMQMTSSCTVFEMLVAFLLPVSVLEDFYQSCPIA